MTAEPVRREGRLLVAATHNPGKVREMLPVLAPALDALGCEFRPLGEGESEPPEEDRETFEGNAVIKALHSARDLRCVSLGEDSGLEVEALGGRPGVRSARFSGGGADENNALLLRLMDGVPRERRAARFQSVLALKVPGGRLFVSRGAVEGDILTSPQGLGGFGYDPVFRSRDLGVSFAEAGVAEKNRVSHRARALRALRAYLFEVFDDNGNPINGGIPGTHWCLEALRQAHCPKRLITHQLAVSRLCRELAMMLIESGQAVDLFLVSAAALLHDIAKVPAQGPDAEAPDRVPESADPEPTPDGVTEHAWRASVWMRRRGLHPGLGRAVMVHGLDSMVSPVFFPTAWEERILMLCDKLVEDVFVGLKTRLGNLKRRYPEAEDMFGHIEPALYALEEEVARTLGLDVATLEATLRAVLENVSVFDADAGADDIEARF